MDRVPCPYCGEADSCTRRRVHDDGTEWKCQVCREPHTLRDDRPGEAFAFFPGHILAAVAEGESRKIQVVVIP